MGWTREKEKKIVAVWRVEGVEITVWFISCDWPDRKKRRRVAVWMGAGVETTVWLISWDRPERKESGSVDGSRRSNHLCGSFHGKDQREGRVDGSRRILCGSFHGKDLKRWDSEGV
jgi:hypothetical protein